MRERDKEEKTQKHKKESPNKVSLILIHHPIRSLCRNPLKRSCFSRNRLAQKLLYSWQQTGLSRYYLGRHRLSRNYSEQKLVIRAESGWSRNSLSRNCIINNSLCLSLCHTLFPPTREKMPAHPVSPPPRIPSPDPSRRYRGKNVDSHTWKALKSPIGTAPMFPRKKQLGTRLGYTLQREKTVKNKSQKKKNALPQERTKEPRNKNRQSPILPKKTPKPNSSYDTANDTRPRKYWYWLLFRPPRDRILVHTATNILLLAQLLLRSRNSNGLHCFENTGARFSFCHCPGAVYWYWYWFSFFRRPGTTH